MGLNALQPLHRLCQAEPSSGQLLSPSVKILGVIESSAAGWWGNMSQAHLGLPVPLVRWYLKTQMGCARHFRQRSSFSSPESWGEGTRHHQPSCRFTVRPCSRPPCIFSGYSQLVLLGPSSQRGTEDRCWSALPRISLARDSSWNLRGDQIDCRRQLDMVGRAGAMGSLTPDSRSWPATYWLCAMAKLFKLSESQSLNL